MATCAFCPGLAKISGEHIWSEWMRDLFTATRFRFIQRGEDGSVLNEWPSNELDLKANVVCKPCNEGWMSNLESQHAKPSMLDLIVGDKNFLVSQSRASSVAFFAFKTAVIVDHMRRKATPFFRRSIRHQFAKTLKIPPDVRMWFCGYLPIASGRVQAFYPEAGLKPSARLKLFVCTYAVGHLVFQVVAARYTGMPSFAPTKSFENLSIPLWPEVYPGIKWPPPDVLRSPLEFDSFSERWGQLTLVR